MINKIECADCHQALETMAASCPACGSTVALIRNVQGEGGETLALRGPTHSWDHGVAVSSLPTPHVVFMGSKFGEAYREG